MKTAESSKREEFVTISVYMSGWLAERVKEYALKEDRSMSQMASILIKEAVQSRPE